VAGAWWAVSLKVVVDTSALVSALVFPGGAPEQVYRLAIEGRITMVTSPPLLAELGRVLTAKLGWQDDYVRAAIAQIVRIGQVVEPVEQSASSRKTRTMIVPSRPRRLPRRPSSSAAIVTF
jgi:putative PIN family toxin of toxin-antitoxin system